MKTLQHVLVGAAVAAAAVPALAQAQSHDHHGATAMKVSTNAAELSEGEVRKVDKEQKKITVKHGPIRNLDMPPMTMVFQVADQAATMLDKVKPGDKVRFVAANPGGKLTLTEIQPAK